MATVSPVGAASGFSSVKGIFSSTGTPVVDKLKTIAQDAVDNVDAFTAIGASDGFLTENQIETETGFTTVTVTAPEEPTPDALFQQAIDYIDWLSSQTISDESFPQYEEIITDAPDAPTVDTDDITGRLEYNYVSPPNIETPEWDEAAAWGGDESLSQMTEQALDLTFGYSEAGYTSELLDDGQQNLLYTLIKEELRSGNFGIDKLDDERVFERMKDREYRLSAVAVADAMRIFSAGGFTSPTGALQAAVARIEAEARDKLASANREIASKKADLYLEAKKTAVTFGLQIEAQNQTFYNAQSDRLLKAATDEIQASIAIAAHNLARVKMFVERYVAFAQAFEARVRASGAAVELYKSQIEGETAKAAYNKSLVDEFVAKNQAVVQTYEAAVKGFSAIIDGRVRYHGVLADFYKSKAAEIEYRARAMQGAYDLAEKGVQNSVQFRIGKYNADIAASKDKLERITANLNFKLEQIKSELQAQTSVAAAAMAALNVNLGLSVSGSANIGGSESVTESYDRTAKDTRTSVVTSKSDSTSTVKTTSTSTNKNTNDNTNHEPDAIDTFEYTYIHQYG